MISMYSDAALSISFDSVTQPGPVSFFSRPARDVAFEHEIDRMTKVPPPSGDRLHDDALDAIRGLLLSVVLGLGCWIVIGVVVRAVFF